MIAASEDTRRRIHDQTEFVNGELQKYLTTQQQMLSKMFQVFYAQLEKLTAKLNQKVNAFAAKTGEDHHMLAAYLTRRIHALAHTTRADNDKVAEVMEARLARLLYLQ